MSQDIVERLRCFGYGTTNPEVCREAADTIESLRARVAELEAEADPEALHIAYLHGQADRDQRLAAKDQRIAELEVELENEQARGIHSCHPGCLRDGCVNRQLRDQLAECQAREAKRITELRIISRLAKDFCNGSTPIQNAPYFIWQSAEAALALPDNSTEVLQEWLDKQLGDPVCQYTDDLDGEGSRGISFDPLAGGEPLYHKPEIK